jgi:nucleoside-diphosphate-sugar epimerase
MMNSISAILSLLCWWSFSTVEALAARISVVTGANGYVGREVVKTLLQQDSEATVLCLVRPHRIEAEKKYWNSSQIHVLPYDMNDGGATMVDALQQAKKINEQEPICVYHVASVFGPTEDPVQTALENVKGTEDLVRSLTTVEGCRLVLTSSMAAVRGTGQEPLNGKYYTYQDWNTLSKLDANNWGSCYQWSKAESERRAWELAKSWNLPMSTICPSFVFGPGSASSSFSVQLVDQWVHGRSAVQSRLCVDVRDVATAHVEAGTRAAAIGQRLLVSTEARVSSEATARVIKAVCREEQLGDPEKIHFDANFQGGSIPIGEKEVDAAERLESLLGLKLRSVEETIGEMARALLQADRGVECP